ncbi:hypothetical protein P3T35_003135 [Kitasatospora sp. GP30]|uniref:hypothetical protein n=1 Tax=Kitasatospora sp. GP30 TaxID=3035084 RepID=UPI000C711F8D|nr:hypothetical protein [Kitasatospora sp. GP30]MDH6141122.1 hypothetical protein [Kitasatospora sp. GP30]
MTATPPPLSDEQLTTIRARHQAATSGPWRNEPYGGLGPETVLGPGMPAVAALDFGDGDQADADRDFVLNAHTDMAAVLAELDRLRAERDRYRAAWHSARRRANHNHNQGQRFQLAGGAVREALVRAGYITRRDTVADAVQKIDAAPRPWYVRWLVDRLQYAARAHASTVLQAKQQARRADQFQAEVRAQGDALVRCRAQLATVQAQAVEQNQRAHRAEAVLQRIDDLREQWADHCLGAQARALLADVAAALTPPADGPSTSR